METAILTPALALVTWTLIVWTWMHALRIPAMNTAGIDPGDCRQPGSEVPRCTCRCL